MGLPLRVAALEKAAPSEERRAAIRQAASRLINTTSGGMGAQYKFFAVTSSQVLDALPEEKWPFEWEASTVEKDQDQS